MAPDPEHEQGPIQPYDQEAWAATFDYLHRDPTQSLELFRVLRASNVALLASVPRGLWRNYGVHQERGRETIARLVHLVAGHDLNHMKQIEELLGRRPESGRARRATRSPGVHRR